MVFLESVAGTRFLESATFTTFTATADTQFLESHTICATGEG